jgi:hypothetical protein
MFQSHNTIFRSTYNIKGNFYDIYILVYIHEMKVLKYLLATG